MSSTITYSYDVTVKRATRTTLSQKIAEFIEPVTGFEEVSVTMIVPPNSTEVVALGGLQAVKALMINAKPEGGVDNVNMLAIVENEVVQGVTDQTNEVRFGSQLVVLDTRIKSVSLKNLSPLNAVTVVVQMLGE
jgi:hypothetical protein